jgi:hypothetical protein
MAPSTQSGRPRVPDSTERSGARSGGRGAADTPTSTARPDPVTTTTTQNRHPRGASRAGCSRAPTPRSHRVGAPLVSQRALGAQLTATSLETELAAFDVDAAAVAANV